MTEYALNTITEPAYRCIIESYRICFPDLANDIKKPYVNYQGAVIDGKQHMVLMVFGNSLHMDNDTGEFILRVIDVEAMQEGEFCFKELGRYKSLKELIMVMIQRQLDVRLNIFFENEINDDENTIPFSSRFECALRGKQHKEYGE